MEKEFWLERWQREEIGFHQNEPNPYLKSHWQKLHLAQSGEIFVPLCGKSLDMLWLRKSGHKVLGVELSPIAVEAFFRENGYAPAHSKTRSFERCEADGIGILCGDFFSLEQGDLARITAVYDRASLVALPPGMRARYVQHLVRILPAGTHILLITFDYPQNEMSGPPFAVSVEEVEALYRPHADIQLLEQVDALALTSRFRERGLTRLHENIFLLTLNRN